MDITFDKYVDLCEKVYNRIDKSKKYDGIVCILRGGVFLADYLSRKMELPVEYFKVSSYKDGKQFSIDDFIKEVDLFKPGLYLLVDDIYDTGETIKYIKLKFSSFGAFFIPCVLVTRGLQKDVISGETLFDNNWVNFWWETITNAEGK